MNYTYIPLVLIMKSNIAQQVKYFYRYLSDVLRIYNDNITKLELNVSTNENDENDEKKKSFLETFLLRLYLEFGIKRKLLADDKLVMLFYDKTSPKYDADNYIVQLCRHLILDTSNFRIVSMGIPKSVDYNDFKSKNNISECQIYEHIDGTMLIYSPELNDFNTNSIVNINQSDIESNDSNSQSDNVNEVENDINKYSFTTRKVMGTSYFNSTSKTFYDMFVDNNNLHGTDLNKLPDEFKRNYSLVFNIQHKENRVVTPNVNRNVLCRVFKFKNQDTVNHQWDNLIKSLGTESFDEIFEDYYTNMVTEESLELFRELSDEYSLNLNIVDTYYKTSYEIVEETGEKIAKYEMFESFEDIQHYVDNMTDEFFQGLIIYNSIGQRTKIYNPKYLLLLELKGHSSIRPEQNNIKNLFCDLYWRLRQKHDQSLKKFCDYFELENKFYNYIFNWFTQCVHNFTIMLHTTYMNAFVYKNMHKIDIPYELKPLCGELHSDYIKNRIPININRVITMVNTMPAKKIYWRIFENNQQQNENNQQQNDTN